MYAASTKAASRASLAADCGCCAAAGLASVFVLWGDLCRTHHFRVLREAGVIEQQALGTSRLNSLRREDLDRRFPGLLDAVLESVTA